MSPRASLEQLSLFLDKFGACKFRHADELVPIMRRHDVNESYITRIEMHLNDQLRNIYRARAGRLASTPPLSYYPPGLADDVRDLANHFRGATDQKLQVWITLLRSGTSYHVWLLMDDERIAGCVKSADQRIVNPPAW